jgi:hypothetical protein
VALLRCLSGRPSPVKSDEVQYPVLDLCAMHLPLFVGLISMLAGSTLPEDIATSTRRLVAKGHDILGMVPE